MELWYLGIYRFQTVLPLLCRDKRDQIYKYFALFHLTHLGSNEGEFMKTTNKIQKLYEYFEVEIVCEYL